MAQASSSEVLHVAGARDTQGAVATIPGLQISHDEAFKKIRALNLLKGSIHVVPLRTWLLERKGINESNLEERDYEALEHFLTKFVELCRKKWGQASKTTINFEKKFSSWLTQDIVLPQFGCKKRKSGRPSLEFDQLGPRAKDNATIDLRKKNSSSKLLHATKITLRKEGQHHLVYLLNEAIKTPERALKLFRLIDVAASMTKAPRRPLPPMMKLWPFKALAHLLLSNWTRQSYEDTRQISKSHGADIWPPYAYVQDEKKKCHPPNISYGETKVSVSLVDRVIANDQRLVEVNKEKINHLLDNLPVGGTLKLKSEGKVGFDGSTGHSIYNQAYTPGNKNASDASLLATCFAPLLYETEDRDSIFLNPAPQSSSFCQPLTLEYKKEDVAASKSINDKLDMEIAELKQPHRMEVETSSGIRFVEVKHKIHKTMLDCKAKNAICDNKSAMTCFLCKATPKQMNNLKKVKSLKTIRKYLKYSGICNLHAWLRCFDAINKLSDRLDIKKWKAKALKIAARRQKRIERYWLELGLVVDQPRAGGAGNSNTGNTARRAFENSEVLADITGVNATLIYRLHVLCCVINCDHTINKMALKRYGEETARLWVLLYGWCYMPVTVHQLCFHAWESLRLTRLPLSFLSEQTLESTNKLFKQDRLHHSRKTSRLDSIMDQFHRQCERSDLMVALEMHERRKKCAKVELPEDALNLLVGDYEDNRDDDNDTLEEIEEEEVFIDDV